jgi:hypothetical protein
MSIPGWLQKVLLGLLGVAVLSLGYSFVVRMFFAPPMDSRIKSDEMKLGKEEVIQVMILNATGEQNIAKKTMDYLRNRSFDVVDIDNDRTIRTRSIVIDAIGDSLSSQKVAYALGIDEAMIISDIDSSLFLQCKVVLGKDYLTLKPFK